MSQEGLSKAVGRPDQLVIESGPLAARVYHLATALGVRVFVADTTQDAWRWKSVKRETDAYDAAKLRALGSPGPDQPGAHASSACA